MLYKIVFTYILFYPLILVLLYCGINSFDKQPG